jgi:predicted deacylase
VLERQLDEGRRLARAMQAAVILTCPDDEPVSFDSAVSGRWAAERRTADARFAATIELRGMMDVTPAFAESDAAGLYRYLVDISAVDDKLPAVNLDEPVTGDVDAAQLIATPMPGALLYDVGIGDWVTEGQRLATVLADAGTTRHEIRAPFDGLVMTRRDRRLARRGEEIIKVLRHPRP